MAANELVHMADPYILSPVMNVSLAKQRLQEFQAFIRDYLVEGEDFGKIPGAPKPCLLKPGADKLCELYGLADDYVFIDRVEDFDRSIFDYTIKCILTDRRSERLISTGLGSCNSLEQKYRWRESKRLCPQCGKDSIIKSKAEYGGGWICFAKKGGCGAKFSDTDDSIVGQTVGRALNEDIADLKNTILKMAKKRAKVDATLSATRSSGVFTQDIEDWPHAEVVPPPLPEMDKDTLDDALDLIAGSQSMDELKGFFDTAKAAALSIKDAAAVKIITQAKDQRKNQIKEKAESADLTDKLQKSIAIQGGKVATQ